MFSSLIVAAGKGTRMGPQIDKLFLEVAGRPVIVHTWQRFESAASIDEIVLVVREGLEKDFHDLASRFEFKKPFKIVRGGKERQDSVWNGLQALSPASELVAIQDGARPCTSVELITATIEAAQKAGAAVAAQRVTDTIKQSENGETITQHLDRARLWSVQTPQCFRTKIIRRALSEVRQRGLLVTDDTAACELIGQPVRLVESTSPNPKITVASDVPYLELLLTQPSSRRMPENSPPRGRV